MWLASKTSEVRLNITRQTDARVRMTNEIINGIQVIKMFAWETLFAGILGKIRRYQMLSTRNDQFGADMIHIAIRHYYFQKGNGMHSHVDLHSRYNCLPCYDLEGVAIPQSGVVCVFRQCHYSTLSVHYFVVFSKFTLVDGVFMASRAVASCRAQSFYSAH